MARIRYLKPDFFRDEDLAEHPFWVRILYQGLWCFADKAGRLEDRPRRLKADIFPYDDVDVEDGLQILAKEKNVTKRPFIVRYQANGRPYIQVIQWWHQKPHHTEPDSIIPPCTPPKDKGNGEYKGKGQVTPSEVVNATDNRCQYGEKHFQELWDNYPSQGKVHKKLALRHFKASVKTEKDWNDINTALEKYKKSARVAGGFIQNGSTWFNNWRDWINYEEFVRDRPLTQAEIHNREGMMRLKKRWQKEGVIK